MMMNASLAIAANTIREAVRERLMYNLVVFAVVLVAGSLTISQLTLGEQSRIIVNVGTSSTQVFGTLIAVFMGVSLLARELDRRTCYSALAHSLSRSHFVIGKYLGLMAVLALNVALMAAATGAVLWQYTANYGAGPGYLGWTFAAAFWLLLVQFAICVGFAVLFSSFSSATLAVIFTLTLVVAGHVFGEVRPFWLQSSLVGMKQFVRILDLLLPNMGLLDLKEAVTYQDPVAVASVLLRSVYGLAYSGVLVTLASVVFGRRDIR